MKQYQLQRRDQPIITGITISTIYYFLDLQQTTGSSLFQWTLLKSPPITSFHIIFPHLTLERLLSTGPAAVSATGRSLLLRLEYGTVCRLT